MINNNNDLAHQITAKQAEVANYERIFNAYWGRWRDLGWRHLQELRAELAALLAQQDTSSSDTSKE